MHSSCAVAEGAYSISAGAAIEMGLARYHILYPLKQNSGEHMESSIPTSTWGEGDSHQFSSWTGVRGLVESLNFEQLT